ncbi:hypothetical protein J6590_029604 [Homalodisca vitripennis]|nr:hypothetical protein J6590_029604 [Homalodisca vitripennis]
MSGVALTEMSEQGSSAELLDTKFAGHLLHIQEYLFITPLSISGREARSYFFRAFDTVCTASGLVVVEPYHRLSEVKCGWKPGVHMAKGKLEN